MPFFSKTNSVTPVELAPSSLTAADAAADLATQVEIDAKISDATGTVDSDNLVDGTITHADIATANKDGAVGTASMRTLGTGALQSTAGNDARLSDTRTPTDGSVTPAKFAASAIDPVAGTAGARTLGAGSQQAAAGNDSRFTTIATHALNHKRGGSDEIDGDELDVDFVPSSYTRTTGSPGSNAEHLAAHLRGVDASLAVALAVLANGDNSATSTSLLTTSDADILGVTIVATNRPVLLLCSGSFRNAGSGALRQVNYRLCRGSGGAVSLSPSAPSVADVPFTAAANFLVPFAIHEIDPTPGTGSIQYFLRASCSANSACDLMDISITAIQL